MKTSDNHLFEQILSSQLTLPAETIHRIVAFRELLLAENERQNLTRIAGPQEFFEGHVLDCVELLSSVVGLSSTRFGVGLRSAWATCRSDRASGPMDFGRE